MEIKVNKEKIDECIEAFGVDNQILCCIEEFAEVTQCITKLSRHDSIGSVLHLTEEMADVIICLNTLQSIYNIPDSYIQEFVDSKQKRTEDIINQERS